MGLILLAFLAIWLCTPWLHRLMGHKVFYLLAAFPAAALVFVLTKTSQILGGTPWVESVQWIPELNLELTFRMDTLAWVMSLLVLGVGSLVLFYCASYFEHSTSGVGGFAAHLFSFAAAMFGLITADDFIVMFIFWEITTILSYLLIGYSRNRLSARRSALQALTVTTAGGLAMFIGLVMLGQSAGTYSLHELVARGPEIVDAAAAGQGPMSWAMLSTALVLILCGALSKSALFPVHFWLPGAMAAPTPVSAYLHAAAMVKAGIYLLIRLSPGYGEVPIWHSILVLFGAFTMLFGGWVALKQTDLKLILAYGTISQLGFLALIIAAGTPDALYAAIAMMLAHSLFKAALFLTVGIIDHQAGTRDIHKLSGIYRRAPRLFAVGAISAASMAGLPPLAGFVAKEAVLETSLHELGTGDTFALLDLISTGAIVLGSVLTFAYSARFVWGAFAVKPVSYLEDASQLEFCDGATIAQADRKGMSPDTLFHPVSPSFIAAPAVLTLLTIAYGLYPEPVHKWAASYVKPFGDYELHLALWHGLTPALFTSLGIITAGVLLFLARRPVEEAQKKLPSWPAASIVYRDIIDALDRLAVWVTARTQRGSLGFYLSVILTTAVVVPTVVLFVKETPPLANIQVKVNPAEWAIAVVMIIASLVVLWARKRFLAILMVSVTGYGVALLFALRSAPDLALTQLLVETIVMVAFVLAMRVLPRNIRTEKIKKNSERAGRTLRVVISVGFGLLMMALAMFTFSSRELDPISLALPKMAYEDGDGMNIVNVILVDIRGWDTFGEISVLALAATGVASLLFIEGRGDRGRERNLDTTAMKRIEASFARRTNLSTEQRVAGAFSNVRRDPFIVAGRTLPPERRSILLEVMTRLLFHTLIIISFYMLVGGHNLPGGGFAGGLLVGLAMAVRYLAGRGEELRAAAPMSAGTFLGLGLGIAAAYAFFPILLGDPAFTSYTLEWDMPIFGHVKFVTAVIFDIGVYLLVIGLVLDVLRSLGEKVDQKLDENRKARNQKKKASSAGGQR
nr:Na+/H+ antiporter subunit A [Rothia aerolata]